MWGGARCASVGAGGRRKVTTVRVGAERGRMRIQDKGKVGVTKYE